MYRLLIVQIHYINFIIFQNTIFHVSMFKFRNEICVSNFRHTVSLPMSFYMKAVIGDIVSFLNKLEL